MTNKYYIIALTCLLATLTFAQSSVSMREEKIVLPSYKVNPADPNPMFYSDMVYQGARKKMYPYPLIDKITSIRSEDEFNAVYLENDYIQLSILPEIGGRLFSAIDKTNNYDYLYRQHVIKPALIGMLGSWISGGIEFCVFHHHRNTTHMPLDYTLEENPDGSKTVWFGETERRHRMRWIIGITVYPDRSYFKATVKMFNRTSLPHSILYWANVAVHVNDDYQVIFPPSVQVATYHSKNDFTNWPVSKGTYRDVDYEGVDLSWWKNHPRATSFFAWDLQEDFMGGYDHGKEAGLVHVGNHHILSGAKLWEWGPDNIWDTKILTDSDGPYAELMVGAFSDNQPDYSWIKPYEVKTFSQYWYPVRDIGGFKNANLDAAVNLELTKDHFIELGLYATSKFNDAKVTLTLSGKTILEKQIDIAPDKTFTTKIKLPADVKETDLKVSLTASDGRTLIEYQPAILKPVDKLPTVVKEPKKPQDIDNIEQLYLTGLRLQQIHNPSIEPMDYYNEALKRDPYDSRTNTIVGINYNKLKMYDLAEKHLRKAIKRITAEYTRPSNTEAYYYLGLALKAQNRSKEAYDAFFRATWDHAFHSAAYYQLATLSCQNGDLKQALEQVNMSLATNSLSNKTKNLKAMILRKLTDYPRAQQIAKEILSDDPLNFLAMNELYLIQQTLSNEQNAKTILDNMTKIMHGQVQTYLELATDYMDCVFTDEAIDVLKRVPDLNSPNAPFFPMVYYYLGYLYQQNQMHEKADQYLTIASQMPTNYCFPFRHESITVLNYAIKAKPSDSRAYYYLGNLLYDIQPDNAIELWEKSAALDSTLAIVNRNLGWGYHRQKGDTKIAIISYEKAIALNNADPTYYIELDDIYQRANTNLSKRLDLLNTNTELITNYNPLIVRKISLLVKTDKYDTAIDLLSNNTFYTIEGGGDILHTAHVDAHLLSGLRHIEQGQPSKALDDFMFAKEYPENLSLLVPKTEKRSAQMFYHIALAYDALNQNDKAKEYFNKTINLDAPKSSYDARFYQAMALKDTGRKKEAETAFDKLIADASKKLSNEKDIDFFAKFGEQLSLQHQKANAHYALGLGYLGIADKANAMNHFKLSTSYDKGHTWAKYQLSQLN